MQSGTNASLKAQTIAHGGHTAPPAGLGFVDTQLAMTVMSLAAALEVQEVRIKAVLLEAAQAGDLVLVQRILELWVRGPVSRVIAQLDETGGVQIGGDGSPPEEVRCARGGDVPGLDREAGQ